MRRSLTRWLACSAVTAVAIGCVVSDLDLDGLPCPCASTEWQCDEATRTCVRAESGPFSLAVTPGSIALSQTRSVSLDIELTTATDQTITVRAIDLPEGLGATPSSVALSATDPAGRFTLSAGADAPIGMVTIEIEGTGPAGDSERAPVAVEIGGRPGTVDTSFGDGGLASAFPGPVDSPAMALRPDDRIVATTSNDSECFVLQFTPDGALDSSFGSSGIATTSVRAVCRSRDLEILADGKVLIAGHVGGLPARSFVVRLLADGRLDTSFGIDGVALGPTGTELRAIAVRSDGRIIGAETGAPVSTSSHITLFRYLADGTPDPSFGTGGRIANAVAQPAVANALIVLPDNRIVVAGHLAADPPRGMLARFSGDGAADESFGVEGVVVEENMTMFTVLHRGPDETLLAGGAFAASSDEPTGGFIMRHDASGRRDLGFGDQGRIAFDSTVRPTSRVTGIATGLVTPLVISDRQLLVTVTEDGEFVDDVSGYLISPIVPLDGIAIQRSGKLIALSNEYSLRLMRLWP